MKTPKFLLKPSQADIALPPELEEEIRHRAFEIYEERGKTDGHDVEDWLHAEEEIMTHRVIRKAS
jgi:Protein of unknown function (DUF2934)